MMLTSRRVHAHTHTHHAHTPRTPHAHALIAAENDGPSGSVAPAGPKTPLAMPVASDGVESMAMPMARVRLGHPGEAHEEHPEMAQHTMHIVVSNSIPTNNLRLHLSPAPRSPRRLAEHPTPPRAPTPQVAKQERKGCNAAGARITGNTGDGGATGRNEGRDE